MHEKRSTAPRTWKIPRKELEWTTALRPGPHSKKEALPLVVLIRDILNLARNKKEVKALLNQGEVKVDLKVRKKLDFPVGVLDSISIGDKDYRIIIRKGKISAIPTEKPEKKVAKIKKKQKVGDKIQYTLHDGKNLLLKENYGKGGSLLLKLPGKEVLREIPLKEGVKAYVYKGSHKGEIVEVSKIKKEALEEDKVKLKAGEEEFETLLKYVIAVGEEKPLITLRRENDRES